MPEMMLLFDIKTIHRGGVHYKGGRLTNGMQSGAVMQRASTVNAKYLTNAQKLDRELSRQGTTPIEDRLRYFGDVRGVVVGAYSEASRDVHNVLEAAADKIAERGWRAIGARTQEEARGFYIALVRRRMGLAAARAMARHRLSRVPWVGVARQVVVDADRTGATARRREHGDARRWRKSSTQTTSSRTRHARWGRAWGGVGSERRRRKVVER